MRTLIPTTCCLILTTLLPAQIVGRKRHIPVSRQPAFRELNSSSGAVYMGRNTRLQAFYGAVETNDARFRIYDLDLRYDGPRGQAPAHLHDIQRVRIEVG